MSTLYNYYKTICPIRKIYSKLESKYTQFTTPTDLTQLSSISTSPTTPTETQSRFSSFFSRSKQKIKSSKIYSNLSGLRKGETLIKLSDSTENHSQSFNIPAKKYNSQNILSIIKKNPYFVSAPSHDFSFNLNKNLTPNLKTVTKVNNRSLQTLSHLLNNEDTEEHDENQKIFRKIKNLLFLNDLYLYYSPDFIPVELILTSNSSSNSVASYIGVGPLNASVLYTPEEVNYILSLNTKPFENLEWDISLNPVEKIIENKIVQTFNFGQFNTAVGVEFQNDCKNIKGFSVSQEDFQNFKNFKNISVLGRVGAKGFGVCSRYILDGKVVEVGVKKNIFEGVKIYGSGAYIFGSNEGYYAVGIKKKDKDRVLKFDIDKDLKSKVSYKGVVGESKFSFDLFWNIMTGANGVSIDIDY